MAGQFLVARPWLQINSFKIRVRGWCPAPLAALSAPISGRVSARFDRLVSKLRGSRRTKAFPLRASCEMTR
jgi:hypothetical protein